MPDDGVLEPRVLFARAAPSGEDAQRLRWTVGGASTAGGGRARWAAAPVHGAGNDQVTPAAGPRCCGACGAAPTAATATTAARATVARVDGRGVGPAGSLPCADAAGRSRAGRAGVRALGTGAGTSRPGTCTTRSSSVSSWIAVSLPPQTAPVSMACTPWVMVRPSADQWPQTIFRSRSTRPGTSNQGYSPCSCVPGVPLSSMPMRPRGAVAHAGEHIDDRP